MRLTLPLNEVKDLFVRKAFELIRDYTDTQAFLKGRWRFVELTFTGPVSNFTFRHGLPFTPRDVLQTALTGSGALTWNYELFDNNNISVTTTGPCVVRAFVGSYTEG